MKKRRVQKKIAAIGLILIAFMLFGKFRPHYVTTPDYGEEVSVSGTTEDVTVSVTRLPGGRHDWQEYQYQIENHSTDVISDLVITIPVYGEMTALQLWGIQAEAVDGKLTIYCSQTLQPGERISCTQEQKFGYSGGARLKTPKILVNKDQ